MTETQKLSVPTGQAGDHLSWVAIFEDTIAGGAFAEDSSRGAVYVWERDGDAWTLRARLSASAAEPGDRLGTGVAISGDVIVAGGDELGSGGPGVALVFVRPAGGWVDATETARLVPTDAQAGAHFGFSVDCDGSVIVVGAYAHDGTFGDTGKAYVFLEPAGGWSGTVNESAALVASDAAGGDELGIRVAVEGRRVVCGARFAQVVDAGRAGAAYVFEEPAGGWRGEVTECQKLVAPDGEDGDRFGSYVGIRDPWIVAGATRTNSGEGSVYAFACPLPRARLVADGPNGVLVVIESTRPIEAWQLAFAYDPTMLRPVAIERGPDYPAGAPDPVVDLSPVIHCAAADGVAAGLTLAAIYSDDGSITTGPGEQRLLRIVFRRVPAEGEACSLLRFVECLGPAAFPIRNVVTIEGARSIDLATEDVEVCVREDFFIRGDCNGDRWIDVSDAVCILRYLFAALGRDCLEALDADNSDTIELSDAMRVVMYLFQHGSPPAAPFPACGEDRDGDDALTCEVFAPCQ